MPSSSLTNRWSGKTTLFSSIAHTLRQKGNVQGTIPENLRTKQKNYGD